MKRLLLLCLPIIVFVSLSLSAREPEINSEYGWHVYVDSADNALPYRMLVPEQEQAGEVYPLVIFLHGAGESGTDNEKQLTYGASIFSNPVVAERNPAFVVFPQCKEKSWTGKIDRRMFMRGNPTPAESVYELMVMDLLRELIKSYPVDANRVYIVGISTGAVATYDLVCRYPEMFAAAVPICGAVNPDRLPAAKGVSFMIFHGEVDDTIPVICGREAYKTLKSAGATVDYNEFAGIGHDCWTMAFNTPSLLPWLFAQNKGNKASLAIVEN